MKIENIRIVSYQEEYAKDFYDLNAEWLKKYFYIEPYDEKVLQNPKKYIIDNGGYIFFAIYKNEVIGVASLINQDAFFELSKMAVLPKYHGNKIGELLVKHCIEFGKKQFWDTIILYSNRKLFPAINLYKKLGFKEIPLEENVHYNRADIKMKIDL